MNNNLDHPFYYLENFRFVLSWIWQRYADLLSPDELEFIQQFGKMPIESQALLVRMVMRRGNLFRASKLNYQEIGDTRGAAQPLIALGWLDVDSLLTVEQLYGLLTKLEFAIAIEFDGSQSENKATMLEWAMVRYNAPRRFSTWCTKLEDPLLEVLVADLCDRMRLMFFGNLHQDWSEFVLADLGIFTYEKVPFSEASRAFHERKDIDFYLHLYSCRDRLQASEAAKNVEEIEQLVDTVSCTNPWLQNRRAKLLFQIGQEYERLGDYVAAQRVYVRCNLSGTRPRLIRVLEKLGKVSEAHIVAQHAAAEPESAEESQHLLRIMPRLQRKLGLVPDRKPPSRPAERIDLVVARPDDEEYVEEVARRHLESLSRPGESAPVFYVENALINSLFGLLCWDAIFSPVPGAFFHPFQSGPADLHSAHFRKLRAEQFQQALSQLDTEQYLHTIRTNFIQKAGIQSPFVFWGVVDEALLELALACLPADHLKKFFERILDGVAANRSGFPDLIQFWPFQQRYRMIEVKGPGDRLQDNQLRFIDFCHQYQIPVAVCYVEWRGER